MRHCFDYERRIKNLTQKVALNKGLNDGNKTKAPRSPSTHAQQLAVVLLTALVAKMQERMCLQCATRTT
jgi:hypothetical protein